MKVTRPAAKRSRLVGTTKLAGSFRSRKPRRCCAGVLPPSRGWTCCVLTASCRRASSRRRLPGRWKRRWNSGSWDQPLKFSTLPLNCGSPSGMSTGVTPWRRHSRIPRDSVLPFGGEPPAGRRQFLHPFTPPKCQDFSQGGHLEHGHEGGAVVQALAGEALEEGVDLLGLGGHLPGLQDLAAF